MQFTPPELKVKRGDKVVWVNKDLVAHNVTAPGRLRSPDLAPNASWTHVARKAGAVEYMCTLHPTMKGRLVIE
jgi:plastocyanin